MRLVSYGLRIQEYKYLVDRNKVVNIKYRPKPLTIRYDSISSGDICLLEYDSDSRNPKIKKRK